MLGQQVLNQDLNDSSVVLDLSDLSSSIYVVNVEGNNSKSKTARAHNVSTSNNSPSTDNDSISKSTTEPIQLNNKHDLHLRPGTY